MPCELLMETHAHRYTRSLQLNRQQELWGDCCRGAGVKPVQSRKLTPTRQTRWINAFITTEKGVNYPVFLLTISPTHLCNNLPRIGTKTVLNQKKTRKKAKTYKLTLSREKTTASQRHLNQKNENLSSKRTENANADRAATHGPRGGLKPIQKRAYNNKTWAESPDKHQLN
ncbi:hypothetical protein O3G_MSEX011759 [Manduca sexta]|uniref:Uncharacterized protein n=1 Tax=Manduca sexta TaxID=7130 RepID=A0A922CUL6_MANSE|nr:hypothetical protein O3G_MSEX011759 [Manduca sexta]